MTEKPEEIKGLIHNTGEIEAEIDRIRKIRDQLIQRVEVLEAEMNTLFWVIKARKTIEQVTEE